MPIHTSEKQKSMRFLITRITYFLDVWANHLSLLTSQIVQVTRIQTTDKGASLRDLYPGAAYHIQVHHHHHYWHRWHFNNCYALITIDFPFNALVFTVSHGIAINAMTIIIYIIKVMTMFRCLRWATVSSRSLTEVSRRSLLTHLATSPLLQSRWFSSSSSHLRCPPPLLLPKLGD